MATSKLCNKSALCEYLKLILGKYVPCSKKISQGHLVAMEAVLPWQQRNCLLTQQNESILNPCLAHMLLLYMDALEALFIIVTEELCNNSTT